MSITSYFRSSLAYARRNAGKIALVTAAAGAALAVTRHIRQQSREMNLVLERERRDGAARLRQVFRSNSQCICNTYRNLLPKLRGLILSSELINTASALGRLRERPSDMAEKQKLWQQVMIGSITHIVSAMYLCSLLFSFVSLEMNLLARYNVHDEASQQQHRLPAGPLSPFTSKAFLDLVLNVVLNEDHVNRIIIRINSIVKRQAENIDLTHTPSLQDINVLFATILEQSWNQTNNNRDGNSGECSDDDDEDDCSLSAMLHTWLFDDVGALRQADQAQANDMNFTWLIGGLLDICEVLDFNQFVYNNSIVVRNFVMRQLWPDIDSNRVTKRPTFARLLARFSSLASTVLSGRDQTNSSSDTVTSAIGSQPRDSLDRCMVENDVGTYFAASVFLSGEKDMKPNHSRMTHL